MAFNKRKAEKYQQIASGMKLPEQIEAMGHVTDPDGNEIITVSFATERDIVKDLYIKINCGSPSFPQEQAGTAMAIAGAVHELAVNQPVVALDLIGPDQIGKLLTDDQEPEDSEFYAMLLTIMALKNALTSYADYRRINKA